MKHWYFGLSYLFATEGRAQQYSFPSPPDLPNPARGSNLDRARLVEFFSERTPYEFWLTCIIVGFGLVVILLLLWYFRSTPNARFEEVIRSIVVVTVITGALILVTAGYSNEQIAPAFGLFGTIVGYILGQVGSVASKPGELKPDGVP